MIEVRDFIRINGVIGRVEQIGNSLFWLEDGSSYNLADKKIKHSKNIIDLLEVGDIVFIEDFSGYDFIYINDKEMLEALKEDVRDGVKIKSILTKESCQANCYTVEREEEC